MKQLVLASRSPRRKELLEKCCVEFLQDPADIDETIDIGSDLSDEIMNLSYRKASSVLRRHSDAVIIGSDTIVAVNNEVLGKPKNHEDAAQMLRKLSGHTHQVITGLCILSDRRRYSTVSISYVTFAKLSDQEIQDYISSGEADDKAGAYGIQGAAAKFITHIDGDFYSIMGLPVHLVYEELKNLGAY